MSSSGTHLRILQYKALESQLRSKGQTPEHVSTSDTLRGPVTYRSREKYAMRELKPRKCLQHERLINPETYKTAWKLPREGEGWNPRESQSSSFPSMMTVPYMLQKRVLNRSQVRGGQGPTMLSLGTTPYVVQLTGLETKVPCKDQRLKQAWIEHNATRREMYSTCRETFMNGLHHKPLQRPRANKGMQPCNFQMPKDSFTSLESWTSL